MLRLWKEKEKQQMLEENEFLPLSEASGCSGPSKLQWKKSDSSGRIVTLELCKQWCSQKPLLTSGNHYHCVIICRLSLLVLDFAIWLLGTTSFNTPHKNFHTGIESISSSVNTKHTAGQLLKLLNYISIISLTAFKLNKLHKNLSNSPAQY